MYISQVIAVHVKMESAFIMMVGVMAMMTVEITVMKKDVGDGRWEETHCFAHIILAYPKTMRSIIPRLCFNRT